MKRPRSDIPIVKDAQLLDVIGRPRAFGEFLFIPALLEMDASAALQFRLQDHLKTNDLSRKFPFPDVRLSSWTRARIPRLFQFTPPLCGNNWQPLVNVAFLAIGRSGRARTAAYPFVCTEGFDPRDGLREDPLIGLLFSRHAPALNVKERIAHSFWSLFLEDPRDVEPYVDYCINECVGYCMVGFDADGFFEEAIASHPDRYDLEELDYDVDPYFSFFPGEMFWCFDCDGTGVEDRFPYREECGTRRGAGIVTW